MVVAHRGMKELSAYCILFDPRCDFALSLIRIFYSSCKGHEIAYKNLRARFLLPYYSCAFAGSFFF